MEKTTQGAEKNAVRSALVRGFLALAAMAVLAGLLVNMENLTGGSTESERVMLLENGWYYLKDGARVTVQLPGVIEQIGDESLVLYNDTLTGDAAGMMLTTRGAEYNLRAKMGENTIYEYSDTHFPRNDQMKSKHDCDIQIPADMEVTTLALTYETAGSGRFEIPAVYIGSGKAVLWYHFTQAAEIMALAFIFIIFGVVAVGVSFYLDFQRLTDRRFLDVAFFFFICAIWFVTDSSITQAQIANAPAVCIVSFYAFMLLAVPMLHFVKNTGEMRKYRILDWLIVLFYLNAVGQGILNLWLKIAFRDMLLVTHLLLAAGVVTIMILLAKEYRENKTRETRMISMAFGILGASGILSIILYWLLKIPYYGSIFEIGILIFAVMIMANIIISMAENIHYRTEMQLYQQMEKEDWMTGLKSRQSFGEKLQEIQETRERYKHVFLVFLNLEQLKKINDELGRAAGDELVIGAAKCILNVFADAGDCFRLEGGEFAVVMCDPQGTAEEWRQRFDKEILQYNKSSRYELAIVGGASDLVGEDGIYKTISDWKYEANCNLNENKDRIKRV